MKMLCLEKASDGDASACIMMSTKWTLQLGGCPPPGVLPTQTIRLRTQADGHDLAADAGEANAQMLLCNRTLRAGSHELCSRGKPDRMSTKKIPVCDI
jgi:hypothetical protein